MGNTILYRNRGGVIISARGVIVPAVTVVNIFPFFFLFLGEGGGHWRWGLATILEDI